MLFLICWFLLDLPMVLASSVCTSHIRRIERQEGIPNNLLLAMAHVESGRYDSQRKTVEPWPWTVQSQGKSNYFNTRHEAVAFVNGLIQRGIKNIDIGCMQMNVEHHSHKFPSIEHMFDPALNVSQGARYLRQLKDTNNQAWSTAVGNYHSFTPEHHNRYKDKVYKKLGQVSSQTNVFNADYETTKGSLYQNPIPAKPAVYQVSPSLYSYNRSYGLTGARTQVKPQTHKIIKVTSKGRVAMMKSKGVKNLAFMEEK